jgi:glutaredoxin 2
MTVTTKIVNAQLSTIVVTRDYLISLLEAWKENKITTADVYETADQLYSADSLKILDWENGEDYSVTMDMLSYLEMMDINFIIQEDIDPAIEFLRTEIGNYKEGSKKWYEYKSTINYEERMEKLKGQYPYISID